MLSMTSEQQDTVMAEYYVYIMTNYAHTLYTGVTNDLERRVLEHKMRQVPGFTAKYGLCQLVYYENTGDVYAAITREKQIKGWLRKKKVELIESINPEWRDLSLDWMDRDSSSGERMLRYAQHDKRRKVTSSSLRRSVQAKDSLGF